eukprot:1144272-Pelagomonas_calceolata.AAC.2
MVHAQVDYPAACNAVEKVLVHASWASNPGTGPASGLVVLQKVLEEAGVKVGEGAVVNGWLSQEVDTKK